MALYDIGRTHKDGTPEPLNRNAETLAEWCARNSIVRPSREQTRLWKLSKELAS